MQRPRDVWVGSVGARGVPQGDALVIGQVQQVGQTVDTQICLLRAAGPAVSACAKGQAGNGQSCSSEFNGVHLGAHRVF